MARIHDLSFDSIWFPEQFKQEIREIGKKDQKLANDVLDEILYLQKWDKLSLYKPYGHPDTLKIDGWSHKPWQTDFHEAGATKRERMLIAANRVGKTQTAAAEATFHATGLYPEWWTGRRFSKPTLGWTGSPTNETSRDIVQKSLIGGTDKESLGSGWIPRHLIVGKPKMRQAGVSDVADVIKIRHVSGGLSTIVLKTYEQGWRKWQGTEPDWVWMDEEPEDNELQGRIHTEALTRLLTSNGLMMVTFTPLLGITRLVEHFQKKLDSIYLDTATWDDAPHLDETARNQMMESYPEHEREARTRGVPMMGEGRVFLTNEDDIKVEPFEIPNYFARIKGIDFGIDHPAAVAELAWDRDRDIIYLTRIWKKKNAPSEEHAEEINRNDPWVPVAWPHDGSNREKSSGRQLKDAYRNHGVKLLALSARYNNDKGGSQPTEPIILEINERCRSGSFKVFNTCTEFFDEYRNYHRKNGVLSKVRDDALKATFYGVMMRRFASTMSLFNHTPKQPRAMKV